MKKFPAQPPSPSSLRSNGHDLWPFRIPTGFHHSAQGCAAGALPWVMRKKILQPQRGCTFPVTCGYNPFRVEEISGTLSQGSSRTRNPGLSAAIPLGLKDTEPHAGKIWILLRGCGVSRPVVSISGRARAVGGRSRRGGFVRPRVWLAPIAALIAARQGRGPGAVFPH